MKILKFPAQRPEIVKTASDFIAALVNGDENQARAYAAKLGGLGDGATMPTEIPAPSSNAQDSEH